MTIDTVNRATWRVLVSFMVCAFVLGIGILYMREGHLASRQVGQASFGGGMADEAITLFMTEAQLCDTYFREPFETCLIVTYDLRLITFSTHEPTRIGVSATTLIERLKHLGIDPKSIAVVVHNHFTPSPFTDADKYTFDYLRARGFAGVFGIWYTATSRFVSMGDR